MNKFNDYYCPHCGYLCNEGSFCGNCGRLVDGNRRLKVKLNIYISQKKYYKNVKKEK